MQKDLHCRPKLECVQWEGVGHGVSLGKDGGVIQHPPSPLILHLQTFQNTDINCDCREENCKLARLGHLACI